MATITVEFADGALYRFPFEEEPHAILKRGEWTPPYPNTVEDSVVFGLLEMWGQSPQTAPCTP